MADFNSSLPVRTETNGDVVSKIVGKTSGNIGEVNANDEQLVHDQDVKTSVDAVTTKLGDGTQKTKITDGVDDLAVNADGSINVKQATGEVFEVHITESTGGVEVNQFATTVAGVPNTPVTVISYTVPAGKTLMLRQWGGTGSGKIKVELKTGAPASEVLRGVGFTSTSTPTFFRLESVPREIPAGDNVLVILTNKDTANQDLYAHFDAVLLG